MRLRFSWYTPVLSGERETCQSPEPGRPAARAGEGSDWEREEESKNSSAGSAALYWVSHDTQTELS